MKHVVKSILLIVVIVAGISMSNSATAQKTMYLDSIQNVCKVGSIQNISLRAKNFNLILGLQGSINWDTSILKYSGISYGTSAIQLNASSMGLNNTAKGDVSFLWFDNTLGGITVPDTTILFTLSFTVQNTIIGKTPISITNTPSSVSIIVNDPVTGLPINATDTATISGFIGFINQPTITKKGTSIIAVASGTPSGYQWYLNDSLIKGDTSSVLANANAGSYTVTVNYTNGCSLTSTPVLPISLISFVVNNKADANELFWKTANEKNTSHFIIQRSTDGSSFTEISTVKAIGSGANGYIFTDTHPTNGTNYYRLQSVEKGGAATYSRVVSCQWLVASKQLAVYPNPAKDKVTVNGSHIALVQVIDNIGRVVKTVSLKDATNPTLSVNGLLVGAYHLRIQTTDGKVCGAKMVKE